MKKEVGVKRFGKYFCSVEHGEKYAQVVNGGKKNKEKTTVVLAGAAKSVAT